MTVWVVTNCKTYPEAAAIGVFSDEAVARTFADKRNHSDRPGDETFFVRQLVLDELVP